MHPIDYGIIIAYILFASLSFVGLWLATNYRVAEAEREIDRLEGALNEARAEPLQQSQPGVHFLSP